MKIIYSHSRYISTRTLRDVFNLSLLGVMALSGVTGCGEEESDIESGAYSNYSNSRTSDPYYESSGGSDDYSAGGGSNEIEEAQLPDPEINPEIDASQDNLITFAVDVDTASYTIARNLIKNGQTPPPQGIRVEEFINYFDYRDAPPADLERGPFSVHLDGAPAAFGAGKKMIRVGIKGFEVQGDERPEANLVFLLDVSGSMNSENKLGLVKSSMSLLLENLYPTDTISIVTYAGYSEVVLPPTEVSNGQVIIDAMNSLHASGGTNGEGGIRAAYDLAQDAYKTDGINRVILCTDGDFNVGVSGEALYELIEEKREEGVTLSVLGFGMSGYNDGQMEQLADRGNGNYAFIDTLQEAQRVLVERLTETLMVIAKDVKVQLEVNPTIVKSYRLLGYENRDIADHDFRNDRVDAGEIGAGHTVTALIEVELFEEGERPTLDELGILTTVEAEALETESTEIDESAPEESTEIDESAPEEELSNDDSEDPISEDPISEESIEHTGLVVDPLFATEDAPLAFLRLRHKAPDATVEDSAQEQTFLLFESDLHAEFEEASVALRLSSAVAEFAEILRRSPHVETPNLERVKEVVEGSIFEDDVYMEELVTLIDLAQALLPR
jgi:Ca-activated chloride channel homolog